MTRNNDVSPELLRIVQTEKEQIVKNIDLKGIEINFEASRVELDLTISNLDDSLDKQIHITLKCLSLDEDLTVKKADFNEKSAGEPVAYCKNSWLDLNFSGNELVINAKD